MRATKQWIPRPGENALLGQFTVRIHSIKLVSTTEGVAECIILDGEDEGKRLTVMFSRLKELKG